MLYGLCLTGRLDSDRERSPWRCRLRPCPDAGCPPLRLRQMTTDLDTLDAIEAFGPPSCGIDASMEALRRPSCGLLEAGRGRGSGVAMTPFASGGTSSGDRHADTAEGRGAA